MKSRPASIRIRLFEADVPNAIPLALPARNMLGVSLVLACAFVIFAFIEWTTITGMFGRKVDDLFDLTFLVFQGFWALGWSVGVLLLGALTILFAFYSESARLEEGKLVHVPRLGPFKFLVDYDLTKIRDVRLERASSDPDTVQVRFDYEGRATSLGNAMPRADGQRIVHAITAAMRSASPFAPTSQIATADKPNAPIAPTAPGAPTAPIVSAIALIAANVVPVVGVLLFGWDLGAIMLLYWVESGVVAFYTAIKIAIAGKLAAVVAVPFFVGHFGGFMTGHFLLIYALFLRGTGWDAEGAADGLRTVFVPIWSPIAALFVSHGISFYMNFVGERKYQGAKVSDLMTAPYHRIMVMHLTLIFGGWLILLIGMPVGALVILIVLKTVVDLHAHRKEHSPTRAARSATSEPGVERRYTARVMTRNSLLLGTILVVIAALNSGSARVRAAQAADPAALAEGMRLYQQKGDCRACHGWAADGVKSDNQMPDGPSLRDKKYTRQLLVLTIKCGRPNTQMPAFDKFAYSDGRCFMMTAADLAKNPTRMPDPPATLQQREIELIADFLMAKVVGQGPMDYAKCVEFWGSEVPVCKDLKK